MFVDCFCIKTYTFIKKGIAMEPYQYWTIAGFIFLILEIMTLRTFPLVLAGAALFSAVVAYKFPDLYLIQIITCLCFICHKAVYKEKRA